MQCIHTLTNLYLERQRVWRGGKSHDPVHLLGSKQPCLRLLAPEVEVDRPRVRSDNVLLAGTYLEKCTEVE